VSVFSHVFYSQFPKAFSVTISSHHVAHIQGHSSTTPRFFQPESLELFVIDCNVYQSNRYPCEAFSLFLLISHPREPYQSNTSFVFFFYRWKLFQAAYQSAARPVVHDRAGESDGVKQAANSNAISHASAEAVSSSPVGLPPAGSNAPHHHSKRDVSDDPYIYFQGKSAHNLPVPSEFMNCLSSPPR
jgi:hypothetical protein